MKKIFFKNVINNTILSNYYYRCCFTRRKGCFPNANLKCKAWYAKEIVIVLMFLHPKKVDEVIEPLFATM